MDDSYGQEEYEVLASSTDSNTHSFQVVSSKAEAPTNWTKVSVSLPAGTKYFAIHCVSDDHTMFAVDDVTYDGVAMPPTGYRVYKNGQCIASLNGEATGYADAEGTENDVYQVTVVYAEGESAFSNAVSVAATGIQTISARTVGGYKILYRVTNGVYIVRQDGKIKKAIIR